MATLTFIAFLAVVYAVILLAGKRGGDDTVTECSGAAVTDSVRHEEAPVVTVADETPAEKGRKPRKSKPTARPSKRDAAGNADVLDRPVPAIR